MQAQSKVLWFFLSLLSNKKSSLQTRIVKEIENPDIFQPLLLEHDITKKERVDETTSQLKLKLEIIAKNIKSKKFGIVWFIQKSQAINY